MTEPDEGPGWRIRVGGGLLAAAPLSDALRLAHEREDERERAQLERDREMRAQAAVERRGELLMQGHTPKTQAELFQQVSWAQDRQDAADRRREEAAAERLGKPPAYLGLLREAAAEREARKAELEATPASKAELDRGLKKLANTVANTFGRKLLS
jgi:hypothetical protein